MLALVDGEKNNRVVRRGVYAVRDAPGFPNHELATVPWAARATVRVETSENLMLLICWWGVQWSRTVGANMGYMRATRV
jgi:hypothetical protein